MYLFHKVTCHFELNCGQLCALITSSRNEVGQVFYKTCGKKSLRPLVCTEPESHCLWMKHVSNNREEGMEEFIGMLVCNTKELMKQTRVSQPQWNHCCWTWDLLHLSVWFMHLMNLQVHISFKDMQALAMSQLGLDMADFHRVPQTCCGVSLHHV